MPFPGRLEASPSELAFSRRARRWLSASENQALPRGALLAPLRRPHLPGAPTGRAHAPEGGHGAESRRPPPGAASQPGLCGRRRLQVTPGAARAPEQDLPGSHPALPGRPLRGPGRGKRASQPLPQGAVSTPCSSPPAAPPAPIVRPARPATSLRGCWASGAHLPSAAGEPCRWAAWR